MPASAERPILVFDVMAVLGTGNAREMAGGVSAATLPTMAVTAPQGRARRRGAWHRPRG